MFSEKKCENIYFFTCLYKCLKSFWNTFIHYNHATKGIYILRSFMSHSISQSFTVKARSLCWTLRVFQIQKNQKVLYRWHTGMMFGCHNNFHSSFFKRFVIFFNSARIAFIVVSLCFAVDHWSPTLRTRASLTLRTRVWNCRCIQCPWQQIVLLSLDAIP